MKGFIRKSSAAVLAVCLLLTGCGSELQTMTSEEEDFVVAYASGAVAKANKQQTKGMVYGVQKPQEEEADAPDEETEEPDQKAPEEKPSDSRDTQTNTAGQTGEAGLSAVSLTEALGIPSVSAEYEGYQVADSYAQGDYFAMEAMQGNQYIILNIALTNQSDQPMDFNMMNLKPSFRIIINGTESTTALITSMLNDFGTYMETLPAGSTVDTVLAFEVKAEEVQEIQSLSMKAAINGNEYNINLE